MDDKIQRWHQTRLDFLLASLIGKPVVYHAQHYIDGEPTSGWVLIGAPSYEAARERISGWSDRMASTHKPQGHAAYDWEPSNDLNHMAEVEEFIAKKGWQREYILALDDKDGTDGEFELLTTPAIKRAEAALVVIQYYLGEKNA